MSESERSSKALDMMWRDGSDKVDLDETVVFGKGYDFFGLESLRQELITDYGNYLIWPNGKEWSAYCDQDGDMMFEKFSSEHEAKQWVYRDLVDSSPAPTDAKGETK